MTAIVAIQAKTHLWMGADSVGANASECHNVCRTDKKIFKKDEYLIGYTTSFRMGQILEYCIDFPVAPEKGSQKQLHKFLVKQFIPACIAGLDDNSYDYSSSGINFLLGVHGYLFEVHDDFQVSMFKDGYYSVGCGKDYALGSLASTEELDPKQRVLKALQSAAKFSAYVEKPFHILTQRR